MALCPHGFQQGQCLICQTLGTDPKDGSSKGGSSRAATRSRRRTRSETGTGGTRIRGGPVEVVEEGGWRQDGHSTHLVTVLAAIVVALVVVWVGFEVVRAVFRLVEILLVAVLAGFIGYRLGRARGRHDR